MTDRQRSAQSAAAEKPTGRRSQPECRMQSRPGALRARPSLMFGSVTPR